MKDKKEVKNKIITVRMTDEDKEVIDYISDRTNRTMSDSIIRACRFFSNICGESNSDTMSDKPLKKGVKDRHIHIRVNESDNDMLMKNCKESNNNISQYVRKAINAYFDSIKDLY